MQELPHGFPSVQCGPFVSAAAPLCCTDQLQVLVALRRRGLCRGAWHRARTRRHNDRRSSPGFLLQRAYHVPAADILLAAAGAVDDWSAEHENSVVDRFGTPGGDCLQPLGVEIRPGRLTIPVECVKEANMRRDERRSADNLAQPLTEFAQLRAVFDL